MKVAVVGHVEWVDFVHVERAPTTGEIVQATDAWEAAAGGGADAAVQLRKLAGSATLYTALGDDARGRRAFEELSARGVRVAAAWRDEPQRRAVCFLDAKGERTIVLLGPKLVPRGRRCPALGRAGPEWTACTSRAAMRTRSEPRARRRSSWRRHARCPVLREAGVELDVLVASALDAGERYEGGLEPAPRYVVRTEGARGGTRRARWPLRARAEVPGPVVDAYGAGDAFAAGLTFGLASDMPIDEALAFGSRCGAAVLTGRGPYEGQITL